MIKQAKQSRGAVQTALDYIPFGFGLDLVTPSNQTKPGSLRECVNYEININGGYTGIEGYERYDGRPRPSDATFVKLDVNITGSLAVGDVVTDTTTTKSGTIVFINSTYDASQVHIVLTKVNGVLGSESATHTLNVSGSAEATTVGIGSVGGAPTSKLGAQYTNYAADSYRSDITVVPGETNSSILGVWHLNDVVYAFRNHTDGNSAKLWKSTASGWSEVSLGLKLAFTAGANEPDRGETIEGQTSGATAIITNYHVTSGSWATNNAAGVIFLKSQTGTFQSENIETVSGGTNSLTIAGNSSAYTLLPDGRFEFDSYKFASTEKMYGVDGVNYGFEFDGTTFIPIPSGMTNDSPDHVVAHKFHLFFSFDNSVQHSSIGDPFTWSPITGASEINVGDTVTAFKVQPGSETGAALAVISRNRIHILYGSNAGAIGAAGAWNLIQYREEVGAFPYSVQEFGITLMMDDRGINTLQSADTFGNFAHLVASRLIQPFINIRKSLVTASCVSRDKSQYRVFFSDNTALYCTTDNNKIMGSMTQKLDHTVSCMVSQENSQGQEVIYFGSNNGYVYQLDRGTSFDGEDIERRIALNYHHAGTPRVEKSYFDGSFELTGSGYSEFSFTYELGYNQYTIPQPTARMLDVAFDSANWDAMTWDDFIWDGSILAPSNVDLSGSGENISLIFFSASDYLYPLTFSGAQLRMTVRRQLRS